MNATCLFTPIVIVSFLWLIILVTCESLAEIHTEKMLTALFVISIYFTLVTIGNGRHAIYIAAAALLSAVLLRRRKPASWPRDILVAALVTFSLVKATLVVPFCRLVSIIPKVCGRC